ncbi:hypothetical protein Hanom_Chr13g01183261 [Helianthus anomalus]
MFLNTKISPTDITSFPNGAECSILNKCSYNYTSHHRHGCRLENQKSQMCCMTMSYVCSATSISFLLSMSVQTMRPV